MSRGLLAESWDDRPTVKGDSHGGKKRCVRQHVGPEAQDYGALRRSGARLLRGVRPSGRREPPLFGSLYSGRMCPRCSTASRAAVAEVVRATMTRSYSSSRLIGDCEGHPRARHFAVLARPVALAAVEPVNIWPSSARPLLPSDRDSAAASGPPNHREALGRSFPQPLARRWKTAVCDARVTTSGSASVSPVAPRRSQSRVQLVEADVHKPVSSSIPWRPSVPSRQALRAERAARPR